MTKLKRSLVCWLALIGIAGCDTGSPSADYAIGRCEVVVGRTAQGVGGAAVTVPEKRAKIVGVSLIAGGVALEEDGRERMARAEAAMGREPSLENQLISSNNQLTE